MFCKNCGKKIDDNSTFCRYCGTKLEENNANKKITNNSTPENNSIKPLHLTILIIAFVIFIFIFIIIGVASDSSNEVSVENNAKPCTNAANSRYNDLSPSLYYSEMKSENLEYCDIAWHAKNSYGWDCEEITSLGENVSSSGNELGDALLKSEIKGYYQVATCTSGVQLRVYPRIDTYPVITNKTGGFD